MTKPSTLRRRSARIAATLAVAASGGAGLLAAVAPAAHAEGTQSAARHYAFTTLDDAADPTFNLLLGINSHGVIAGYHSDTPNNKGYTLDPPYGQGNYVNENFPGSVQTQVTSLNNKGDTAGFWVDAAGDNFGFIEWNGVFTSYKDPHTGTGTVNQILGINDAGIAVGFYTDGAGINHGFELNQATGKFTAIAGAGTNTQVTGINDKGTITGFSTGGNGQVIGWLEQSGQLSTFEFPGSTNTTPFGINGSNEIVGSYVDASNVPHGFGLPTPLHHAKWQSVDDPNGLGTTTINGVNGAGDLVGFYVDAGGFTDGFLAK